MRISKARTYEDCKCKGPVARDSATVEQLAMTLEEALSNGKKNSNSDFNEDISASLQEALKLSQLQ